MSSKFSAPSSRPLRCLSDLTESERRLVTTMRQLWFCRIDGLRVYHGEPILSPWPKVIQNIKFAAADNRREIPQNSDDFELKRQHVEFVSFLRSIDDGVISCVEVRNGLPASMDIRHYATAVGDQHD